MSKRPGRLTLVGVVHQDPAGEERLTALLQRLAPDRLTLEVSPAAVEYRQTHGSLLLQRLDRILEALPKSSGRSFAELNAHPAVRSIRTLLSLPFEYQAARRWSTGRNVPLELIDSSEISLAKLRRIERSLITYRNLGTLVSLSPGEPPLRSEGYPAAKAMLSGASIGQREAFLAGCRGSEGVGPRDRQMAALIRERLLLHGGHLVHVGGWVHMVDDPRGETLYSALADLAPERLLLDSVQPAT